MDAERKEIVFLAVTICIVLLAVIMAILWSINRIWERRFFAGPIDMRDFPMCAAAELHQADRLYAMDVTKDPVGEWVYSCECGCRFRRFSVLSPDYWQILRASDLEAGQMS